jgi:hypothetical protein
MRPERLLGRNPESVERYLKGKFVETLGTAGIAFPSRLAEPKWISTL